MIVTADWHLRNDVPRCRKQAQDEWHEHQRQTIRFIVDTCNANDDDLVIVGDIFDTPTVPLRIVNIFMEEVNRLLGICFVMAGNHDLNYKDGANIGVTAYGTILHHPKVRHIREDFHVIYHNEDEVVGYQPSEYLFLHEYVDNGTSPVPGAISAKELQEQYPYYKWIIAGDNHTHFVTKGKSPRVLVPGCITKQVADKKDAKLYIHRIDGEDYTKVELPNDLEVVDDSYLIQEHERDERISAFVEKLASTEDISLDFKENVRIRLTKGKIGGKTKEVVERLLEVKDE